LVVPYQAGTGNSWTEPNGGTVENCLFMDNDELGGTRGSYRFINVIYMALLICVGGELHKTKARDR